MLRVSIAALLFIVLSALFLASSGWGQYLQKTEMCDLYVEGIRVTWPQSYTPIKECKKMLNELSLAVPFGTDMHCQCIADSARS